jgi:hypothetical protein
MKTSKGLVPSKPKKTSEAGKAVKSKKVPAGKSEPSEEEIREKAKEIYQRRVGLGEHGDEINDWLTAEEQLKGSKKK